MDALPTREPSRTELFLSMRARIDLQLLRATERELESAAISDVLKLWIGDP